MSEKRFTYDKPLIAFSKGGINDNVTGETYEFTMDTVLDLLNEQQSTIDEQKIIIEERDVANERLNRFLIEIGLEKEYIKWEFKKRCVE